MLNEEEEKEAKFLYKNYRVFLYNFLKEIRTSNDVVHIHPPPAFRTLYAQILQDFVKKEKLTTSDIITIMDLVAKFMTHLHKYKINYNDFTPCSCVKLSDQDLEFLRDSEG